MEPGYVSVNTMQRTTAAGVHGTSDASTLARAQAVASTSGNAVGAMINREMTAEEVLAEA